MDWLGYYQGFSHSTVMYIKDIISGAVSVSERVGSYVR